MWNPVGACGSPAWLVENGPHTVHTPPKCVPLAETNPWAQQLTAHRWDASFQPKQTKGWWCSSRNSDIWPLSCQHVLVNRAVDRDPLSPWSEVRRELCALRKWTGRGQSWVGRTGVLGKNTGLRVRPAVRTSDQTLPSRLPLFYFFDKSPYIWHYISTVRIQHNIGTLCLLRLLEGWNNSFVKYERGFTNSITMMTTFLFSFFLFLKSYLS